MLAAVKLEGLTSELPATAPRLGKGMNTRVREPHEWHRPSVKAAGRRAGLNSLLVKTNGPAFRGDEKAILIIETALQHWSGRDYPFCT